MKDEPLLDGDNFFDWLETLSPRQRLKALRKCRALSDRLHRRCNVIEVYVLCDPPFGRSQEPPLH